MMTSLEYPTGPQVDLQLYENDQHYALISKFLLIFMDFIEGFLEHSLINLPSYFPGPNQRYKPELSIIEFEFEFFKEKKSKKL